MNSLYNLNIILGLQLTMGLPVIIICELGALVLGFTIHFVWNSKKNLRIHEPAPAETAHGATASTWVALTPDRLTLDGLLRNSGGEQWRSLRERSGFAAWTDDHSSVLSVLRVWH